MLKNYDNIAVLIDFDGTITDKDTNVELFKYRGNGSSKKEDIDKFSDTTEYTHLEKMRYIFQNIKITESEYKKFILDNFELNPGFKVFIDNLKKYNIPVAVISGGFINGIEIFFDKHNISNIEIFANKLIFDKDNLEIEFYDDIEDCCSNGPCGNCKIQRYKEYKKLRDNIVFIGDGFTDRWVAKESEILFAKSNLIEYAKKDNIPYIPWENFYDINSIIFEE